MKRKCRPNEKHLPAFSYRCLNKKAFVVSLFFDFAAGVFLCLIKLPDAFSKATHQFWNFTAAKKQQDNECDN